MSVTTVFINIETGEEVAGFEGYLPLPQMSVFCVEGRGMGSTFYMISTNPQPVIGHSDILDAAGKMQGMEIRIGVTRLKRKPEQWHDFPNLADELDHH